MLTGFSSCIGVINKQNNPHPAFLSINNEDSVIRLTYLVAVEFE